MDITKIDRVLMPKYSLMDGVLHDPMYLLPRDTWVFLLDEHIDYDYNEIERVCPDHIITHPMVIYHPFSIDEMDNALEEYILTHTDVNGIIDLSGINLNPYDDIKILEETIECDWLYKSGRKVRYPDGKIVQL